MRAIILSRAILIGACALVVSGCAPHPGPRLPDNGGALPSGKGPPDKQAKKPGAPVATSPDSGSDMAGGSDRGNVGGQPDAGSGFDNLEVIDASLNGQLVVLRVGSDPSPNSLLSIFVGLKNKTPHRLDLELQTIYKDSSGNALNNGSWIPFTLKPHAEAEYHSTSISASAVDFLVRVRRASAADAESAN